MVAVQGEDNLSVKGDLLIKADGTISLKGTSIKIEASSGFEIKCGGSSISVTPSALFLAGGPVININSGSGPPVSGASPAPPDIPKEPNPADNAQPGEPFEEPARPAVSKPEAPAAKVLHQTAENGAPFCEECERARQEQEKNAAENLKSKEIEQP